MKASRWAPAVLTMLVVGTGCSTPRPPENVREFPLTGEVLAIKPERTQIRVKHDQVKGFMDAMTMWFNVRDPRLLDGLAPGDFIRATLVLTAEDSYLTGIYKTGSRPPGQVAAESPPVDVLQIGDLAPDVTFTDEAGRPRPLASYRGTFTLLTFIYTRCPLPEYCPRMNAQFAAVQRGLKADARLGRNVRLLSVSFDPEFDTQVRLAAKAKEMGADPGTWHFVTAPRAQIDAFGSRLGLSVIREGADGSAITHNLRTVLLDRDGRLARTYNGNEWSPDEVLRDLQVLVK